MGKRSKKVSVYGLNYVIRKLEAMLNNVPVVSKKLTNKNEIIIPIIATSRAPKISNFINTGKKAGG